MPSKIENLKRELRIYENSIRIYKLIDIHLTEEEKESMKKSIEEASNDKDKPKLELNYEETLDLIEKLDREIEDEFNKIISKRIQENIMKG